MEKIYKNASCDAKRVMNGFKYLLLSYCLFVAGNVLGQTTLISPTGDGGFENGTTFAANGWTVENFTSTNTNKWFVGNAATTSAGSRCAYIDNGTGTTNSYTTSSATSRVLFWRDVTFPAGETKVTLTFKFKGQGEASYDDLSVFVQNGSTLPATSTQPASSGIATPTISNTTRITTLSVVGSYTTYSFVLNPSDIGNTSSSSTRRLIFYWENDLSGGANPPAAIDEISLMSALPVPGNATPTNMTFATVTSSSFTLGWTDNSTNETSFNVYRSTDNVNFTLVSSPASTTTAGTGTVYTLSQTGLTPGTTYFYRIASVFDSESGYLTGSRATTAGATYYWTGASGGTFATLTNWNTAANGTGTSPSAFATTDVYIIDGAGTTAGSAVTINLGATVSVGQLKITSNTACILQSSATTQRIITITGGGGDDFVIESGSTLSLNNTANPISIIFSGTGNTGDISGTLTVAGTSTTSTAANSFLTTGGTNTIITVSGTGTINNTATSNITTNGNITGSASSLIFANGSQYNVSGASTGAPWIPLATWGSSSTVNVSGLTTSTTAPTNASQSFGNLTINCPTLSGSHNWASSATIQGNLNVTTGSGNYRLVSSGTGTVNGNVVINAGTFTPFSSTGSVVVLGNTTIASGSTLDLSAGSGTYSQRGSTFTNNGTLIGGGTTTGGTLQMFSPSNAAMTLAGTGTVSTALTTLSVQSTGGLTISHTNQIPVLRTNLFTGTVTNSNKITMGTGLALAVTFQTGSTGSTNNGGTFDQSPTWNLGTGTYSLIYSQELGNRTTGFEIPPTRTVTSASINNTNGLTISGGNLDVTTTLTMTAGVITTSIGNVLGLGSAGTLSGTPSSTNMINGPFNRTYAASRTASGTYSNTTVLPVGKGGVYTPIFIDPTTTAGGSVTFTGEAFTTNSGTLGSGVTTLASTRYEAIPTTGVTNLTSAFVRLTNANVVAASKLLQATTAAGSYESLPLVINFATGILTTATSIPAASYTGYLSFGEVTPCAVPTDQAINFVSTNNTSTSYTATFDPAPSGATGYLVVRYTGTFTPTTPVDGTLYSSGSFLGGTVVGNYYSAPFTFSQTGLTAGTTYTYKIYSFNNSGCAGPVYNTTSYDPIVTTCPSTIASAPTSSAATSILTNSFQANWTAVSGWTPTNYILDVATDALFTSLVSGFNALSIGNVTSYNVTGLGSGTTYFYRVRATDGSCTTPNSSTQSPATLAITSIASGNWNASSTWNSGTVPTCGDNITIASTHNVTVNSSSNVSKNLTIASGGTLTVSSGDLTVGCTLNNTPLTNNGTLTVSGGTLNVNGNIVCASGSTFNQSGGDIVIDGNNGNSSGSVVSGTAMLQINSPNGSLIGGTITIVDPNFNSSGKALDYSVASTSMSWGTGHALRLGNGISNETTSNTNGFILEGYTNTGRLSIGNLQISGGNGSNRHASLGAWSIVILGNLTVDINSEIRLNSVSTAPVLAGNIINNGTITSTVNLILASSSGNTIVINPNVQTISGSGTYRNSTTTITASLTSLTVNNSNATGVTLSVPLSISSSLTMTAGRINTTTTNLLTLGTTTAAGTLTYTAGQIVGPFARTFAASRTAAGTYDATTLFPVGDGTNYIPIHIDPTTTSGGAVVMRGQAFNTNSGTGGTGVATTLSSDRWEAIVTSGSSNLTNCFVGLNDAQIAAGNIIAQSATANGTYNIISPASTAVAGTSIRTATAISAADYTGYLTYAAPGPRITSFTPTTACPNAATTITITGTNLGSATSVTLNGEACTITANTATSITATTDATPQAGNIVVTTAANSATSATAMTLFTLPTVTAASNAASNTVCSGTSVTLNGAGATTYAWNNSVTDNTSFTPSTSSNYTVTGTDGNGCTNTASISITVNQIVAITTQPSNQVVLPGANATFTVAATGTGLTYQWEESTDNGSTWNPITNGGVYSGATTNSLLLTSINSSYNNNQYRVVINGTAPCNAETSSAATLTLSSTAITAHPQNETICSSSGTANFSITTSGTTPAYQWQISINGVSWSDIPGENNPTLSLSGLTLSNSLEQYRCQLDFGSIIYSNAATLTVYDPPVINTQPTNLTACSNATSGSFSVSASGSNLTYQWQVSTDGGSSWNNVSGSNISGATSSSLSFSSFTNAMNSYQYRVVVSGSSPCTNVTSNVVTLNITGISVSASASTVCQNSPVTFTVTPNAGSPTLSYSWTSTTGSGASTAVTSNPASITPTASGSYTYTLATTGGGCTFSNTSAVTVNPIPNITSATATPSTVCSGAAITLSGASVPSSAGTATVGTGTSLGSNNTTFVRVGNTVGNQFKNQYLFTAAELISAGLTTGNITSLTFDVNGAGGGTVSNLTFKLGTTVLTNVTSTYQSGLSQVYSIGTYPATGVLQTGLQTVTFTTPFFWDGTSNLILEACSQLATSGSSGDLRSSTTTFVSTITNSPSSTACGSATGAGTSSVRPNFRFGGQVGTNQTSNFTWSWNSSPTFSVASGTTTETNNGVSATNKTYTVTATNATTGCSNTATTSAVTINPATIAPTATNSSQCGSATPSCSVSGTGTAGNTFRWYTAATGGTAITGQTAATLSSYPVSSNTTFHVSESNGTCESPRTQVDVTVSTPPTISVAATVNPVCSGSPTLLSASSSNTGYTYAWSNSLGSGASVTASPTANTTYTVTATDNSGGANNGCATTGSIAVTTNPIPSVLTLSPSVTTGVCNGSIQTISLTSGANGATGSSSSATNSSGTISLSIPDNSVTGVSSSLLISSIPSSATITQVDVTFSLNHTWLNDAELVLIAPNGKVIALAADQGPSSSGSYTNCIITSNNSAASLSTTTTPITGTFKANATAAGSLKGVFGTNLTQNFSDLFSTPNGSWILSAYDDASGDIGTLTSYSISITYTVPDITWSPITDLYTDVAATTAYTGTAATTLYAKPTVNRTYTATATIASTGCTNTKAVQLNNRVPANNVVLASSSTTGAVEQCTDASGWTYYATAAKPDEWLFGIFKNGNNFTATVDINVDNTNKFRKSNTSNGANQEHASYIMSRYWNVNATGTVGSGVKVRFFIDPQDITDILDERDDDYDDLKNTTNPSTLAVIGGFEWFKTVNTVYNPTNWTGNKHNGAIVKLTQDAVATLNGQTYVELSGITSFSGGSGGSSFGPSSNGLFNSGGTVGLPVTWKDVKATVKEEGNWIQWITSSEKNTSHFEVEYSYDAKNFFKASNDIKAAVNSTTDKSYDFMHLEEYGELVYYRIKQVDLDGKVDYSKAVVAKRTSKLPEFHVSMYPVPLNVQDLNLKIQTVQKTDITITINDLLGRGVYTERVSPQGYTTDHKLSLGHLQNGTYHVTIDNGLNKSVQVLVVGK